jgi:hypothetical protein
LNTPASLSAKQLENIAKLQQMKLNCRLVALERATVVCSASNYNGRNEFIEVIAVAKEFESYILDNIEAETEEVLKQAQENIGKPRIVRP